MSNDFIGSRKRFDATDLKGLIHQLNAAFAALSQGAMTVGGLRFEQRTVVPNAAPESFGSPNLVGVNIAGVLTLYWWNGTAWVDLAAGGGSGAPLGADYIVGSTDPTLTAERVLTNTASVSWDLTVAGQVKANATAVAPLAHKVSHQAGGSDEISVAGLTGVLTNPQPPIIGAGAAQAVAGNDARLTDSRTPLAHTHPESDVVGLVADLAAKATQVGLDAETAGRIAADLAHLADSNPHPQYLVVPPEFRVGETQPPTELRAGER